MARRLFFANFEIIRPLLNPSFKTEYVSEDIFLGTSLSMKTQVLYEFP